MLRVTPNKSFEPTRAKPRAAQRWRSAPKVMIRTILLVVAFTIGIVDASRACSCIRESDDKRTALTGRLERATLVFLGRIEANEVFTLKEDGDFEVEYQRTQFHIIESWKGEKASRVYVQSAITCCLCGHEFPKSGVFLVFAYGPDKDGYYEATSCTRPLRRDEAKEDIAILSELRKKAEQAIQPDRARKTRAPG